MRTTLNIDDDVLGHVKRYAESRSIGVGKAASELIRKGLNAPLATKVVHGVHVVVLPPDSPAVDPQHVKNLLEDEL